MLGAESHGLLHINMQVRDGMGKVDEAGAQKTLCPLGEAWIAVCD